jgi:outer membrane lipase/esterase
MSKFAAATRGTARRAMVALATAAAASALLTACGGGDPVQAYVPTRIIALGDEASVITSTGGKYSVNALQTDNTTLDCAANPIWVQTIATSFGLVFPQCNPNAVASPRSRILATPGAKVADLKAQIDTQLAGDGLSSSDMVTVLVGGNDVLEQYRQYPTISTTQATAAVEAAGDALAVQVNRIAATGAKVVLAKVLDLGQTPYGLAQQAAFTDVDRSAFLTNLAARFNARLRVGIVNDGRKIGLVQSDERIQTIVRYPSSFGFTNVTQAACLATVTAPNCTTATLGTDADGAAASGSTWLWADQLNLSAGGQGRLGEIAESIARNNPF